MQIEISSSPSPSPALLLRCRETLCLGLTPPPGRVALLVEPRGGRVAPRKRWFPLAAVGSPELKFAQFRALHGGGVPRTRRHALCLAHMYVRHFGGGGPAGCVFLARGPGCFHVKARGPYLEELRARYPRMHRGRIATVLYSSRAGKVAIRELPRGGERRLLQWLGAYVTVYPSTTTRACACVQHPLWGLGRAASTYLWTYERSSVPHFPYAHACSALARK